MPIALDKQYPGRMLEKSISAGPSRNLDRAWMGRFAASSVPRRFAAGDYVWRGGEQAHSVVLVEQGMVAIQRVTAEGEGLLVALFGPGDTLCIVPALQHIPMPADAIAVTERVDVLLVPVAPVLSAAEHSPEVAAALNRALLQHTSSLRSKIDIVSAGTVPRRVAALLLHLAERFGCNHADGSIHIGPALTREQIGQLVNARTETVIRIMSRWSKAGWIQGDSASLKLMNIDMLKRMAYGPASAKATVS
jgi:cAMP-binding proteins - catabolite gene activator and regulatory subunit of cAMP-dependent protein kinases